MERLGQSQRAWLQTFLAFPQASPAHATFGRVFARLNPARFQPCCLSWSPAVAQLTQGARLAREGQTVQASLERATAASPVHLLSAWCADHGGRGLGHTTTEPKAKEITAIPALRPW
jgi:DDE_Tnp_1-associated